MGSAKMDQHDLKTRGLIYIYKYIIIDITRYRFCMRITWANYRKRVDKKLILGTIALYSGKKESNL
jgi:hypothetical protein